MTRISRLILLLAAFVVLAVAAEAKTITVQQSTIPNWTRARAPILYIFSDKTFTAVDYPSNGVNSVITSGSPNNLTTVKKVTCTLLAGTVTIPSFTIPSTRDGQEAVDARLSFYLYDSGAGNARIGPFGDYVNLQVPTSYVSPSGCTPSGTCMTFSDLKIYNAGSPSLPIDGFYTKTQVDQKILAIPGAGSALTGLNGDVTAAGPGDATATLSTTGVSASSYGSASQVGTFTVDAKGRLTAASNVAIAVAQSQVTNLVADLAAKEATANKNAAGGYAGLTAGKVANSQLSEVLALADLSDLTGKKGNSTTVQMQTGATATDDCAKFDASGNLVSAGAPCGSGSGAVASVFGRTGAVVAATNDYTWAQINKSTSSLADITTRSAGDLSSGTLPDARFPATLPAASGVNLTALNATNIASGSLADARLSSNVPLLNAANVFTNTTNTFDKVRIGNSGAPGASTFLYFDKSGAFGATTFGQQMLMTATDNSSIVGLNFEINSSGSATVVQGVLGKATNAGSGTTAALEGAEGFAQNASSGTVTTGTGVLGGAINFSTGHMVLGRAAWLQVRNFNASGLISTGSMAQLQLTGNVGTITTLRGVDLSGWTNSGTVTTSAGIYADTSIDVGATPYFIKSTSVSPSELAGDFLTSGILRAGSGPTTLTDASGKILSAALNTVAVAQGGTGLTAGTSGGVPYFSSTSTIASSGALTANLPVIGGGAGAAPTVGTRQGNTTAFVTYAGSAPSTNDCAKFDANGNLTTNGSACGSGGSTPWDGISDPSGNGSVNFGTTVQKLQMSTALTNAPTTSLTHDHITSGTPAAGLAVNSAYALETTGAGSDGTAYLMAAFGARSIAADHSTRSGVAAIYYNTPGSSTLVEGLFVGPTGLNINPTGTGAGATGAVRFYELAANGSEYVERRVADSVTSSYSLTDPGAGPSGTTSYSASNWVMSYTAAGTGAWVKAMEVFTASSPLSLSGGVLTVSPDPTFNNITNAESFRLSGDISPSQITANQNDYNPTGLATASTLRLSTDASRNITGLQGGADGRIILVHNVGSNNLVIKDDDTGSSAANRFALNADLTLGADQSAWFRYDSTSSRWRMVGSSIEGAGGSGITSLEGQTGATQTFTDDTNVTIVSGSNAHVITWAGTLAKSRQNAATTYNDASNSWSDGVKQTFNPDATNAGLNVGSQAGDPSSPANGDLWYDSTANELTARINGANVALGAGGGSYTLASLHVFTAGSNVAPAANFATLDTRNNHLVLDFADSTADEEAVFESVFNRGYAAGSITVTIYWAATSATTGDVVWEASFERTNTDIDSDSFATGKTATATTNGTSGILTATTITFSSSEIDGLTAGDAFRIKIKRLQSNGSDTMTGDAEIARVEIKQ